ncbi:MFS transporter [Candidatus Woesearchaeota archaeon]|nr:MFS transporter [Candidatus Woesearchaeota archaeon]
MKKIKLIKPDKLTHEQARKTKKASILDGSGYNVMYGFGEQYVPPFAIRLGATSSEVGILSSVPAFIASFSQIIGASLTDRYKNRKKITSIAVLLQAFSLLPLFLLPLITHNIMLLIIIFSLYLVFGNIAGVAWSSWIGDVVEEHERAKYFGLRSKVIIVVLSISILLGGIILNYFTDRNIWLGFGLLFLVAFIGRMVSFFSLQKHYEPSYVVDERKALSLKQFIKSAPGTNFGNFMLFRSLFSVAIMIAAPFFAVYMLKNLDFTYLQYTAVVLVPMVIKFFTIQYWGKHSVKFGTRNIMYISIFLICLVPLAWFFSGILFEGKPDIFFFIILSEAISGFGWGGFELTSFNYMLETVEPQKRAKSFAYFNAFWGVGILAGGLIGSFLAKHMPSGLAIAGVHIILFLFLLSFIARLLVAVIFVSRIKEVKINKSIRQRGLFLELAVLKPVDIVFNKTNNILASVEKELDKDIEFIAAPAKKTFRSIFEPIEDFVDRITGEEKYERKLKYIKKEKKMQKAKPKNDDKARRRRKKSK